MGSFKGEAEEKIRHANLMLDLEQMKDPIKFAERVERTQQKQEKERKGEGVALLVGGIMVIVMLVACAISM